MNRIQEESIELRQREVKLTKNYVSFFKNNIKIKGKIPKDKKIENSIRL